VRKLACTLVVLLVIPLVPAVLFAQRSKPSFDPETKDGLLIQHIQQETDATERLRFMEQFASQYPTHSAAPWVFDQLQPTYLSQKEWDQAMRIGTLRLAIEPENLDAAKIALRAAEAKHDHEQIANWADRLWHIAEKVEAKGGATAADAKASKNYAEFCLFSAAQQTQDLQKRLDLYLVLDQRIPSSKYSQNLPNEYFMIYRQIGPPAKAFEMAEKLLQTDPSNIDAIMFIAETHFHKETPHDREKVIALTYKAIEILDKKPRPEAEEQAEWEKRKAQMLGMAYYMGGLSSSTNGLYAKADTMLRGALPYIKEPPMEAAALYHLGMANYRLADKGGGPIRSMDALKFMRRCAAIRSPFQDQAIRNIETIKVEFNLK
jgi:tetratricopeptide (TPR) repeat protein